MLRISSASRVVFHITSWVAIALARTFFLNGWESDQLPLKWWDETLSVLILCPMSLLVACFPAVATPRTIDALHIVCGIRWMCQFTFFETVQQFWMHSQTIAFSRLSAGLVMGNVALTGIINVVLTAPKCSFIPESYLTTAQTLMNQL